MAGFVKLQRGIGHIGQCLLRAVREDGPLL